MYGTLNRVYRVVLIALRKYGGVSKILFKKKLKSKVYVSFRIRLYIYFVTTEF